MAGKRKYKIILKRCPVCNKEFSAQEGAKREKRTCSIACSNTHFRSGINSARFKDNTLNYRGMCFLYHKKECVVCGESKIVAVHHYDENHANNVKENLIPLCPTHHIYMHSEFKDLINQKVESYRDSFIKTFLVS